MIAIQVVNYPKYNPKTGRWYGVQSFISETIVDRNELRSTMANLRREYPAAAGYEVSHCPYVTA